MFKPQKYSTFLSVKPQVHLAQQENEILNFWDQHQIFKKTLQQRAESPSYIFYDGPPFATGLPHYGHILAGILKDILPRYWNMKGYSVPRRFGWDCHGLPVEYEINKIYQLNSRKQVLEMGVKQYNAACRGIVQRYSEEWKKTVRRMGRWVDMDNAYFTMDVSFMQSVWWVFQELWKKGLIYEGYKVVPYSVGLSTSLSNFEANLNYQDVQDPGITVQFPLIEDPTTFLLAWTTTPWTLTSHLGLAIGEKIEYVRIRDRRTQNSYILAKALLENTLRSTSLELGEVEPISAVSLLNREYLPPFSYFHAKRQEGAFRIIFGDHVTITAGTGIVHLAPAYGEEDYHACLKAGIPLVNPVDDDGMFTAEVPDYQGRRVKEVDKEIITYLKNQKLLFKQETITHSYPFCWRTHTPLIYRAVSSWFVAVEKIKDQIIANNQKTHWVPEHLRDGRFGKWLENARDWAISRNRFWGTPIPIWKNSEGELICIGSQEELEKLSGKTIQDLHVDTIDSIAIPSPSGKSPLRRVEGVLDCWFESGSMPYAQYGYPQTQKENFHKHFPADFIAEGLDQTRGWFYTLMVIGTGLWDQSPFKNVVVNGLILAEDGKKMSKSLRNYPDPLMILEQHGADALRLYLMDSPVVKAQELKFSEAGVKDIVRKILFRWWNAYSFFVSYANVDQFKPAGDYQRSPNLLDQWLLSRLQTCIENTELEMSRYRIDRVVPELLKFIEELTNTYIRLNRKHFWQEGMPEDKRLAYETLYETLMTFSQVMAPFAPFLSETVYQNLTRMHYAPIQESVHLEDFPQAQLHLKRPELEKSVQVLEALLLLGRHHRETIGVKAKIPLQSMKVIHRDLAVLQSLKDFEPYFKEELNIRKIDYHSDESEFVHIFAKAHFAILGPRVGAKMKKIAVKIKALEIKEILLLEGGQSLSIEGEQIDRSDVEICRISKTGNLHLLTHSLVSIEIDPTVTFEQMQEGLAREMLRRIQMARKNADLILDDRIAIECNGEGVLKDAILAHFQMIQKESLCTNWKWTSHPQGKYTESVQINDHLIQIGLTVGVRHT